MAKTLQFEYEGTEYTLEFTRRTVQEMERNGFVADDIDTKPMTVLPMLFEGAFLAHHRWVKRDKVQSIFDHMVHKDELIGKLAEMYNDPIMALVEEPEETDSGKVDWTANW